MMKCQFVLAIVLACACATVNSQFELRFPRISPIINRLANTTFDFIREGVSLFSRTIERITATFTRVEDRINALLIEFRKEILRGIPEYNVPILDPLHIKQIQFDVAHEAANVKGYAKNITIKNISKYLVEKIRFTDLGRWKFLLDVNLTFPILTVAGLYKINGDVGDSFKIFGEGPFRLNLTDLKMGTTTTLKFQYPRLKVTALNIDVSLKKLDNNFENLMNDPKLGALFNKAISKMAPEALKILWPELKKPVEQQTMKYINNLLENVTISKLIRRLLNIS